MERGESMRDFMKRFKGIIHQLEVVNMDSIMQAVKQAIRPGSQFFNLISLKPPMLIDELFEQANKYSTYEDDLPAASKPAMAIGDGTARSGRTSSQHRCASHDNHHSTPRCGNLRYNNRRKDPTYEGNEVKFTLPLEKILQ